MLIVSMSGARQTPGADAREQIREQVRRDVEQALREAQQARVDAQEGMRAAQEGRPNLPPIPPVPPLPPLPSTITIDGPGTTTGTQVPFAFDDVPQRAQEVAFAFFFTIAAIFIGTPLARAYARRLDRRPVGLAAGAPDVVPRLERIEQAVDAIALEVERISEGQRYVTKLMSESRALPGPNEAAAQELRMVERAGADPLRAGPVR